MTANRARDTTAAIDMAASASWSVPLDSPDLAAVEREIAAFVAAQGVAGRPAFVSELVVEEIVRNLIEHTPPHARGERAWIEVTVSQDSVTVVIEDSRAPFAPDEGPPLDVTAPLEERRPGGMGLHLVRTMTDRLTYERVGERNRLTAMVRRE